MEFNSDLSENKASEVLTGKKQRSCFLSLGRCSSARFDRVSYLHQSSRDQLRPKTSQIHVSVGSHAAGLTEWLSWERGPQTSSHPSSVFVIVCLVSEFCKKLKQTEWDEADWCVLTLQAARWSADFKSLTFLLTWWRLWFVFRGDAVPNLSSLCKRDFKHFSHSGFIGRALLESDMYNVSITRSHRGALGEAAGAHCSPSV